MPDSFRVPSLTFSENVNRNAVGLFRKLLEAPSIKDLQGMFSNATPTPLSYTSEKNDAKKKERKKKKNLVGKNDRGKCKEKIMMLKAEGMEWKEQSYRKKRTKIF